MTFLGMQPPSVEIESTTKLPSSRFASAIRNRAEAGFTGKDPAVTVPFDFQ